MARDFNGSSDYIPFTLTTEQRALTTCTFSWWEYLDSNAQYKRPYHLDTGGNDWRMEFDDGWGYVFIIGWSTTQGAWSMAKPSTGSWHLITVTYDGSSTSNDPIMYVDGVSQSITERLTPAGTIQLPTGTSWFGTENATGQYFDGKLAEFAIWNRVLTASEVASLSKGFSPATNRRGLLVYFPLIGSTAVSGGNTFEKRVAASADDAEEMVATTVTTINSSDLELVHDTGLAQLVGVRFNNVTIPPGSTITNAYLTFQIDAIASSTTATIKISGEDTDDAAAFAASNANISARTKTTASSNWVLDAESNTVDVDISSDDISAVVQEIIDRAGWSSGNDMAFILETVSGTGYRETEAWDGESTAAPFLHVEYTGLSSKENDIAMGVVATPSGTVKADHPRILYPKSYFGTFVPTAAGSLIKTINGLAIGSVKTINGLAIASVKSVNGLTNV